MFISTFHNCKLKVHGSTTMGDFPLVRRSKLERRNIVWEVLNTEAWELRRRGHGRQYLNWQNQTLANRIGPMSPVKTGTGGEANPEPHAPIRESSDHSAREERARTPREEISRRKGEEEEGNAGIRQGTAEKVVECQGLAGSEGNWKMEKGKVGFESNYWKSESTCKRLDCGGFWDC
nr:hypothetical protein Iba_chr08dCG13830 [Ipomoea batatas]